LPVTASRHGCTSTPAFTPKISEVTVNFLSVSDAEQVDDVSFRVEGVDDSIIAHSQPETVVSFQAMMRKGFEPQSHLVNLRFDARANFRREFEESGIEDGVTNLQRRAHGSRPAHTRTNSPGHLALGLLDAGFKFGREFQIILNHVVKQITNLTQFRL